MIYVIKFQIPSTIPSTRDQTNSIRQLADKIKTLLLPNDHLMTT